MKRDPTRGAIEIAIRKIDALQNTRIGRFQQSPDLRCGLGSRRLISVFGPARQIYVTILHQMMQCFVRIERLPAKCAVSRGHPFDVGVDCVLGGGRVEELTDIGSADALGEEFEDLSFAGGEMPDQGGVCLLYTSD